MLAVLANLPISHDVQLEPGVVLTLPEAHRMHVRAPRAPDICAPASHDLQTVCPVASFVYLPFSHFVQFACLVLSLYVSRVQSLHAFAARLPLSVEYVPGGHSLQPESIYTPVAEE